MTEKRFVLEEKIKENEPFCYRIMRDILTSKIYDNTLKGMDDIIILCNNLWEQTQRFENHNQELEKENEQLKADNNRLVNETAKIITEHQGRVLDLIDEKIKELKNINNVSIIPRESIEVLKQLKKEFYWND